MTHPHIPTLVLAALLVNVVDANDESACQYVRSCPTAEPRANELDEPMTLDVTTHLRLMLFAREVRTTTTELTGHVRDHLRPYVTAVRDFDWAGHAQASVTQIGTALASFADSARAIQNAPVIVVETDPPSDLPPGIAESDPKENASESTVDLATDAGVDEVVALEVVGELALVPRGEERILVEVEIAPEEPTIVSVVEPTVESESDADPMDEELSSVVEAWPSLSENARRTILALVNDAD